MEKFDEPLQRCNMSRMMGMMISKYTLNGRTLFLYSFWNCHY